MRQADSLSPNEGPQDRQRQRREFRPDVEGLRAVAVVAVILFHAEVVGVPGGFVGVDVFFVISGFLITGLLWREASTTGKVRLRRFYGARARRLLPASAIVGIVTLIASVIALSPLQYRSIIGDAIASALYVGNYRLIVQDVDYLGASTPPSPFQHYWSLGVEEQFYLVWPALIIGTTWLIRHARPRNPVDAVSSQSPYLVVLSLVAAVSFVTSLVFTRLVPPAAFFSLPTRAWELAVGGIVALTAGHWRRLPRRAAAAAGWAGLGLIVLACAQLGRDTTYPGTAALLPVLGAALVVGAGCATPSQGCGRVLGLRPIQAMGRISYSWYLWHWPVLWFALPLQASRGRQPWLPLVAVIVSAGLAALTLRFVENPLRFAPAIRRSPNRSLALGAAATAVAVGVGVALLGLTPTPVGHGPAAQPLSITIAPSLASNSISDSAAAVQRAFAQVQAAVTAAVGLKDVPSNLDPPLGDVLQRPVTSSEGCLVSVFETGQPECATGDTASSTTVALVGDSNAAMWDPALQLVASLRHWRLETMTKAGCPWLDLPIIYPTLGREYTECARWHGRILARLQAEHPRLIVVSMLRRYGARYGWASGVTSYDSAWIDGLARQMRQLRGIGSEVLVIGPIPDPQSVVPVCLSNHLDDATACVPERSVAVNKSGIASEATATEAGRGRYADISDLFCTADRCPVIVGNNLVYRDQDHVTFEYSQALAPVIGALAERALVGG